MTPTENNDEISLRDISSGIRSFFGFVFSNWM
jgi:hypothetical protein